MSNLVYVKPHPINQGKFVISSAYGREWTKYWNGSELGDIKDAISFPQRGEAEAEVEKNPTTLTLAKYRLNRHFVWVKTIFLI